MLTQEDHARIAKAIEAVEAKTEGDIFCIVSQEVSHYREVPLGWAAIVALVVPPLLLFAVGPSALFALGRSWTAVQSGFAENEVTLAISEYALVQALLFAGVVLLATVPAVRRILTPRFLKAHRVRQAARQHFVSTGTNLGAGMPHILIFLALSERQVEILADPTIHEAAGPEVWREASAAVARGMREPDPTAGIVRAIEVAGAALVRHFPSKTARQATGEGFAEV